MITDVPSLDALQAQMQAIKEAKDYGRKAALKAQFFDDARRYLSARLKATDGVVTREILSDADALYDVDGFPTRLAQLLNYDLYDLQEQLGRMVELSCERCKQTFTVIEHRKLRGYTRNFERYCERCRRIVNDLGRLQSQIKSETAQQNAARAVEIDAAIVRTLYPLEHPTYRAKLLAFLHCWQAGEWRKTTLGFSYDMGATGCMMCGTGNIQVYVTRSIRIQRDSLFAELMDALDPLPREAANYGYRYEPLETYHQALWRLPPIAYFSAFPEYPMMDRPLLCLCNTCGQFFEQTHEGCDLSDQARPVLLLDDDRFRFFL